MAIPIATEWNVQCDTLLKLNLEVNWKCVIYFPDVPHWSFRPYQFFHWKFITYDVIDKGKSVMLVLLDLSSAFDTIDHHILIERMQSEFGITCAAKEWFANYLSDRTNRVCVLGDYSDVQVLKYGVPQGSIAGPPIFTAYAQPVANIIRRFQIGYHIYANDTQLYVSSNP